MIMVLHDGQFLLSKASIVRAFVLQSFTLDKAQKNMKPTKTLKTIFPS